MFARQLKSPLCFLLLLLLQSPSHSVLLSISHPPPGDDDAGRRLCTNTNVCEEEPVSGGQRRGDGSLSKLGDRKALGSIIKPLRTKTTGGNNWE